jgi:hypothetical protein
MPEVLHYRGDITEGLDYDHMIGPDFGKRWMSIKSAHYDAGTDITTVTLRAIMPEEFRVRIAPEIENMRKRSRTKALFGG